jgi:hypothetical protein
VSDEAAVVVGILALLAAMIFAIVRQQRLKEARLASLTEIEIPIQSTGRAALILVFAIVPGPVLVGVATALAVDARQHAAAVVLVSLGLSVVGMFVGMRLARRYARIGLLRYAPPRLELEIGLERWHVDLDQPCELAEASAFGPGNIPLQVLAVKQGERVVAFSYGLPLGRKPYGDHGVPRYIEPLVDAEARVIHDRIRQRFPG